MTPARRTALALGVPVLLGIIGFTSLSATAQIGQESFPVHETFPVRDGQVSMDLQSGSITLRQAASGTNGPGTAELTGTGHYYLWRPAVTTSGDTVRYHCPLLALGNCDLDGTLQVPASTAIGLSTAGGDVAVPSFTASKLTLNTDGGNINAGDLDGHISLRSSGGDVTVATLAGSLDASLDGGNLQVANMTAATASIQSSGGDITLAYTAAPDSLRITSDGGNVNLDLPRGGQYRVDVQATGGNVTNTIGDDPSATRTIIVHTSGGDITIK